jgi:hypothetical protein
MNKKVTLAERLNTPTDFSIVEEYIEDQAPRKIHDAFNRIKPALQNSGAVANEPPTAATTPCLCDVGGCGDIASIYLCKKHFNSVNAVVKMPSSKLAGMEKHPNLKVT